MQTENVLVSGAGLLLFLPTRGGVKTYRCIMFYSFCICQGKQMLGPQLNIQEMRTQFLFGPVLLLLNVEEIYSIWIMTQLSRTENISINRSPDSGDCKEIMTCRHNRACVFSPWWCSARVLLEPSSVCACTWGILLSVLPSASEMHGQLNSGQVTDLVIAEHSTYFPS